MLIDDCLLTAGLYLQQLSGRDDVPAEHGRVMHEFAEHYADAAVIALDPACARFIDSLALDMARASVDLDDIRLPHDTLFIEYPFKAISSERASRSGRPVASGQHVPDRVGVLLRRKGNALAISLATSGSRIPAHLPALEASVHELATIMRGAGKGQRISLDVRHLPFMGMLDQAETDFFMQDLVDEIPMILATLLFLVHPDRETVSIEPVDNARINANRLRRGKPPLRDHRTMRLEDLGRVHMRAVDDESRRSGQSTRRAHHVRGHYFRNHGTMTWRRPHLRCHRAGDPVPAAPRTTLAA